jgi:uncharacterized DUF497 family protein
MTFFEWDEAKSESNLRKHGLSFKYATQIFDDPFILAEAEGFEGGEVRWQSIGMVEGVAILLVAHTHHEGRWDEVIRVISARRATRKECKRYEQSHTKDSRCVQTHSGGQAAA